LLFADYYVALRFIFVSHSWPLLSVR